MEAYGIRASPNPDRPQAVAVRGMAADFVRVPMVAMGLQCE